MSIVELALASEGKTMASAFNIGMLTQLNTSKGSKQERAQNNNAPKIAQTVIRSHDGIRFDGTSPETP
jgi:hypothetical protein